MSLPEESLPLLTDAESFFRALFTDSPLPQWIVDLKTTAFLEVNASAAAVYGYQRETFLSSDLRLIRPNDDVLTIAADYRRFLNEPEHTHARRHRLAGGQWLDVEIKVSALQYRGREAALAQVIDQSKARAAMEEAAAANRRIDTILRGALDAVVSIDRESRIIEWAGESERIFGWSREEALGRPMHELIMPLRYRDSHLKALNRYFVTGQSNILGEIVELEAIRKSGDEFPIRLRIMRVDRVSHFDFTAYIRDLSDGPSRQQR